ncbi:MAG TPA: SCO6880 family protein [Nonomuraea sp.]|nr:SCO6880 family protein [Nonomuraea sp.]
MKVAAESAPPRSGYVFGPRETRGLLIGLRGTQLAILMVALGALVLGLSSGPAGAVAGTAVLVVAAVAVFAPLSGRTPEQWAPVLIRFVLKRMTGRHLYKRPLDAAAHLPEQLRDVRIISVPVAGGPSVGIVEDSSRGTLSAVMSVNGESFALLDPSEQERRAGAWGALLAGLARDGSPVTRVQWVARAVPDTGQALRHFWERAATRGGAAAASYEQLQAGAGAQGWRTETYLTVVVDARRARSRGRAPRDQPPPGTQRLMRELAAVEARLAQCGLHIGGWLPPRGLAKVLRESYAMGSQRVLDGRGAEGSGPGVDPALAGPMAARDSWSTYRTDDAWHATYWIHEWPRLSVGSDFLGPLLSGGGARRTLSLIAEPVDSRHAARQIAAARTAEVANQAMRDRVGQLTTERNRAEAADVERREHEIAAGHADYRFIGLLTVSAESPAALDEACAQAEVTAHACYLEILRLYGEQDEAFAAALPIGRGLR